MHRVQGSVAAVARATHPARNEGEMPPAVGCLQRNPNPLTQTQNPNPLTQTPKS